MAKQWYGVELSKEHAELHKAYLRQHNIYFEPSEMYNLVHLECYMTEEELHAANKWALENLH